VERLISASSLASLVEARAGLARIELDVLQERQGLLTADRDAARADLVAQLELVDRRGEIRDRLLRDALRVVGLGLTTRPLVSMSSIEQDAIDDQLALGEALRDRAERLVRDEAALGDTLESVAAKEAELARLSTRATLLLRTDTGAAQVAILRALADEAAATANAIADLTRTTSTAAVATAWTWPLSGFLTQRFGPSEFGLEPPVTYRGMLFAHFHDAIDIGASLGAAIVSPASGRVTFVGHLPDGAMVVVIAHDDGLVSLSAHLDDAFALPPVRAGDVVKAGQVIGYVGMSGVTTGPHLHFAVHDANGPVDPLTILSAR
jgi:murein DD-endopeptidase MepM/ murein hydrolase activator NlpD